MSVATKQSKDSPLSSEQPRAGWRVKIGFALFLASISWPVLLPILPLVGVSTGRVAAISGFMLVAAEVMLLVAAAIAGKEGFAYIKSRVFGFLKQYGPPREVSRTRYTIGLVIFSIPLIYGWLGPYIEKALELEFDWFFYAILDIAFVVSLFVLGGEFWDKIRALFSHGTKVMTPEKRMQKQPQS